MLDKDRVYEIFLLYSDLEDDGGGLLRLISDRAAESLAARVSDKADPELNKERLCRAAAGLAFSDMLLRGSGTSDEIRVGDVSIRSSAGDAAGASDLSGLRDGFLADIADLLIPPLVLRQVKAC